MFFILGFQSEPVEVDWTKVYPELAEDAAPVAKQVKGAPVALSLDKMMADAKIGPELIESLGSGMRSLSENATKLADISNASVATNEYVGSVRNASQDVSHLADTYN